MFRDRTDAGNQLSALIRDRVSPPAVILAIPRGGVVVGWRVAAALGWPLDLVVTKKIGAPGNPELGIGAAAIGVRVLDTDVIEALGVPMSWVEHESARVDAEVRRRDAVFRSERPRAHLDHVTAVVVDDGVATGGTARAAGLWGRAHGATRVILAVPVGPPDLGHRMRDAFDEVLVLDTPGSFRAVGEAYADFDQVNDDKVLAVLATAWA